MRSEYLIILLDYIFAQNKREVRFEWGLPALITCLCVFFAFKTLDIFLYDAVEKGNGIVGTLLGFTLAALTLFLTGNEAIEQTKMFKTNKIVRGQHISLYQKIVMSYSYLIVVETILVTIFFVSNLFSFTVSLILTTISNGLFIFLVLHVFCVTIDTVSDLYFILIKRKK